MFCAPAGQIVLNIQVVLIAKGPLARRSDQCDMVLP